jgi:Alpha/beta hydrolase of unknown function (DUF900)
MKSLYHSFTPTLTLAVGLGLALGGSAAARAQTQAAPAQNDSIIAAIADAQGLPRVPADQLPALATYWTVQASGPAFVLAPLPWPQDDLPAYEMAEGQYLLDATHGLVFSAQGATNVALSQAEATALLEAQATAVLNLIAEVQNPPINVSIASPMMMQPMGAGGTLSPQSLTDNTTNLWIQMLPLGTNPLNSNTGAVTLVLHNTLSNELYEILSSPKISNTNRSTWYSEGFVYGAPTNWTPTTVSMGTRTNALFLSARWWQDTTGSGIPSWWFLEYGVTNTDPYALCPSGDGWTLLQAFQNGWNPNLFYAPPPPQNVAVHFDSGTDEATITWQSGGGPVTGYAVLPSGDQLQGPLSTNTFTFNYAWTPGYVGEPFPNYWTFVVRAYFANGSYADSPPAQAFSSALSGGTTAVRGPAGQECLCVSPAPPDSGSVRVYWFGFDPILQQYLYRSIDLPGGAFTNGVAALPLAQMTGYAPSGLLQAQYIGTNGNYGALMSCWPYPEWPYPERDITTGTLPAFVDARPHLKENLRLLLAWATVTEPFSYLSDVATEDGSLPDSLSYPEAWYARAASPTGYEYYGFHTFSPNLDYAFIQLTRPFFENHLWRNLAFDSADFDSSGQWTNSKEYYSPSSPGVRQLVDPHYQFTGTTNDPLPLALTLTGHPYLYARQVPTDDLSLSGDLAEIGIGLNYTNTYLLNGVHNVYGLAFNSVLVNTLAPFERYTLSPGGPVAPWFLTGDYFCAVQAPILQITNYYFASQTPYFNNGPYADGNYVGPAPPLPGSPTFSVTNASPLLITGLGQPITVSGWAKQTIVNGYSGKYAYLEQYFTNALTIGADGKPTTNSAGLLSPYGEFFPTQPGPAALTTLPDIDTGQQGTGVVNVIKLQLDVNHDRVMDLSFGGPDNTSQARPFVFWVNNDYDRLAPDSDDNTNYDDSVSPSSPQAVTPYSPWQAAPDSEYRDAFGHRVIPNRRDLQDFARLWVCGVTSNVLAALPPGTTVTLDWGDVGNPNPANPTIDLFPAADPDGGIGYLTNATIAATQVTWPPPPWRPNDPNPCPYAGRLGPGQSIQLNGSPFTNHWAGNYFIWCGVSNGTGGLTLTIAQGGTNVLAQTTMYIQLVDIKQMYERWTIGDRPSFAPTNVARIAQEDIPLPFQYPAPTDTNTSYILYVHGWNVDRYDKDRFAETAFKRLYWQGYQGRFGAFRWPTDYGFKGTLWKATTDPKNYDNSEYTAWQSATGLLNKLNDLNGQYPGHVYMLAHSMGNVVAGEALRLAGASQVVNTYVASQGAIPAHVYDSTVTNLIDFTHKNPSYPITLSSYGPDTPNIYGNWLAGNSAAVGRRVNFCNPTDFALSPDAWCFDQELKPDTYLGGWWGYNGSTNDPPPWNHFYYQPIGSSAIYYDINVLTNRYEIMAYAAEARSRALGSTPTVGGLANVNLQAVWPNDPSGHNYADHFWHSAEFRGDNWQQQSYWRELLGPDAFNLRQP